MPIASVKDCAHGRLPLCVRYGSLHAGLLSATVRTGSNLSEHRMPWALGVAHGGEVDVLGVWAVQPIGPQAAEYVTSDLSDRGLQRLGLLVNGAGEDLSIAVRERYVGAVTARAFDELEGLVLPLVARSNQARVLAELRSLRLAPTFEAACTLLRMLQLGQWSELPEVVGICEAELKRSREVYALSRRLRLTTHRAEQLARRLQGAALSALRRQGPFTSANDAAALGEAWLCRAQRRWRNEPIAPRLSESRRGRPTQRLTHRPD